MSSKGMAMMGIGIASGENRDQDAAIKALSSPLLIDSSIRGAEAILLNITGGNDIAMTEVQNIAEIVYEAAGEDAAIYKGVVIDPDMEGFIKVTVVATGLGKVKESKAVNLNDYIQPKTPTVENTVKKIQQIKRRDLGLRTLDDYDDEEINIPTYIRNQAD